MLTNGGFTGRGEAMKEPKFKVGDKVDFINDYGVVFEDRIIIGIDTTSQMATKYPEMPRYHIEPTDCPWYSKEEKNLRLI